jgi:hypothetical protein
MKYRSYLEQAEGACEQFTNQWNHVIGEQLGSAAILMVHLAYANALAQIAQAQELAGTTGQLHIIYEELSNIRHELFQMRD